MERLSEQFQKSVDISKAKVVLDGLKTAAAEKPSDTLPVLCERRIEESLLEKLRLEALRLKEIATREEAQAVTEQHIAELSHALEEYETTQNGVQLISFTDFEKVRSSAPEGLAKMLTNEMFMRLRLRAADAWGRVPCQGILRFVTKNVSFHRNFALCHKYSMNGKYLVNEELVELLEIEFFSEIENEHSEEGPSPPSIEPVYYRCFCEQRIFFLLDPQRRGRVRISDLVVSGLLEELYDVVNAHMGSTESDMEDRREWLIIELWLSVYNCTRILSLFRELDTNKNGMLDANELQWLNGGSCNRLLLSHLFNNEKTFEDEERKKEIDFSGFLNILQAMENKKIESAVRYLFRALDIDGDGALNREELRRHTVEMLQAAQRMNYSFEGTFADDIVDELFDMARPADPTRLTLRDLFACGKADTVLGILTDARDFVQYEDRENVALGEREEGE